MSALLHPSKGTLGGSREPRNRISPQSEPTEAYTNIDVISSKDISQAIPGDRLGYELYSVFFVAVSLLRSVDLRDDLVTPFLVVGVRDRELFVALDSSEKPTPLVVGSSP